MSSVKSRAARTGVKYVVTHPRSRITHFAVRFVMRRLTRKVATSPGVEAIPAVRGSRLTTVGGVVVVAGGIIMIARRGKSSDGPAAATTPSPFPAATSTPAPFPAAAAAAAPPETRDAPSVTPTTSQAAEAAAIETGESEDELVARVEAKLVDGAPTTAIDVEANAGVITLRGEVADEDAEARVVRDAEAVDGVKAVQSELSKAAADEPGPAAS
jgi:BON domain